MMKCEIFFLLFSSCAKRDLVLCPVSPLCVIFLQAKLEWEWQAWTLFCALNFSTELALNIEGVLDFKFLPHLRKVAAGYSPSTPSLLDDFPSRSNKWLVGGLRHNTVLARSR
jgi:hypothetical protein